MTGHWLILMIISYQRDSFRKEAKWKYVLLLFICPMVRKSALWNHNLPHDRWACTSASCFLSQQFTFQEEGEETECKDIFSICLSFFSFITLVQKIVFWLAAWLATHVTLKVLQTWRVHFTDNYIWWNSMYNFDK